MGAGEKGSLRLLPVDDHPAMRHGLRSLLEKQPGVEVVGEASDGLEAVEPARTLRPEVVLMDVSMPKLDGVEATRRILAEAPGTRVVGLSMHDDPHTTARMKEVGASGHVSKSASAQKVVEAIRGATKTHF